VVGLLEWSIDYRPAYSILKVKLSPGEEVTSEPGAMLLYKGDVEIKTHTAGGAFRGLLRAVAAGESFFVNTYKAKSPAEIWFAPSIPGDIMYMELSDEGLVVQDTSYLAHHGDIGLSIAWRGLRGFLAEGELFWLKVAGRGGVWINSYGSIDKLELKPGERVIIDNFHFVALTEGTKWRIRKFGGWKSFIFGGEGLVVEVEGPGTVYVQSRILPTFAKLVRKYMRK